MPPSGPFIYFHDFNYHLSLIQDFNFECQQQRNPDPIHKCLMKNCSGNAVGSKNSTSSKPHTSFLPSLFHAGGHVIEFSGLCLCLCSVSLASSWSQSRLSFVQPQLFFSVHPVSFTVPLKSSCNCIILLALKFIVTILLYCLLLTLYVIL